MFSWWLEGLFRGSRKQTLHSMWKFCWQCVCSLSLASSVLPRWGQEASPRPTLWWIRGPAALLGWGYLLGFPFSILVSSPRHGIYQNRGLFQWDTCAAVPVGDVGGWFDSWLDNVVGKTRRSMNCGGHQSAPPPPTHPTLTLQSFCYLIYCQCLSKNTHDFLLIVQRAVCVVFSLRFVYPAPPPGDVSSSLYIKFHGVCLLLWLTVSLLPNTVSLDDLI